MSNDIEVRIGSRTSDLEAGMGRATRVIADSMSDIRRQLDGIGNMFNSVIGLAGGAGLAMLGRQAVGVMSNFEQLEIRLNSVMGSVGKGQEAFAWIQQFAKDTPYQVNEVTQSFMLLKNMGIDPMGGAMKSIADRAAQTGGGFETLQRISLGLGQAWTKGKLQGEEAMQLLEAGVPVWDMLSKVLGKTTAEVQELSSKGRLGRDVLKALIDEMGRSSEGAAEAQMKSLGGMWSNFIDNIEGALNRLRKDGALDPLKTMMSEMNAEFEKLESNGTLARWSSELAESIKAVGSGMASAKQFVSEYGDQIKFLAGAYVTLKAAQAGSNMVSQLTDEMRARVAGMAAAKEKAAADLAAANASSIAAKQTLLLAESENTAARAELQRAAVQVESWQAALRSAKAETDLAARTQLTAQAQTELTAALAARNTAVARAATATEALGRANTAATASTKAATVAQVAFERATTVAGLAARGFSTVMTALGGPVGIAIMALVALVTHWDDVAAAAGNAAAKSRKAADDIKQALSDVDVSRMRQGLKEATDEFNRLKLKRQTSGGNLTVDQRALGAAEDEARGRMLLYQKGLDDVQKTQAQNAYQPILDKYKGEDPEWRKQQEEKKGDSTSGGPPKLLDEKEKKKHKPKEESRLSEWNNELDSKRLDAEMAGSKLSAQAEADFWQQKLALTKAGSKEREQVVRQHTHALLAIQREGDRNAKELEQAQMDARRQAQDTALQIDEAAYQREVEMLGLSADEQEATLIAFEQRRLEIKQSFLDQRIAALERDPDHNIAEVYRLQQEREQAEVQHQARLAEIRGASAKPGYDRWQGAEDDTSSMYEDGLQRMLQGTLSFKQAIQGVWAEIGRIMVQNLVLRPAAELAGKYTREIAQESAHHAALFAIEQGWLTKKLAIKLGLIKADAAATATGETVKTGAVAAGEAARTGATATGTLARLGLKAMEAVKSIMLSAWEAMASAFKAIVGIPYVGPVLAVGAGAAAFAAVSGIASRVKSARGGYSIPRGVNPMTQLHEEEMVLPKPYAEVIREMAEGKGGGEQGQGGAAAPAPSLPPIQLTGVSAGEFFVASRKDLLKVLKAAKRDFAGGF
ncbi:tape measure protein [Chromobacterium sp. LK1]|uniref:tape measure protein n=1 Tax=Chromobacterium sp. LK1 TaxID=1628193 RepID=UPI0009E3F024|nr:tape measure protein [Chromobacterium sp. LK1]